jgi:hypothetical protein
MSPTVSQTVNIAMLAKPPKAPQRIIDRFDLLAKYQIVLRLANTANNMDAIASSRAVTAHTKTQTFDVATNKNFKS